MVDREEAIRADAVAVGGVTVATALALPYRDSAGAAFPRRDAEIARRLSQLVETSESDGTVES